MAEFIVVSDPCGCGKAAFTEDYMRHLADQSGKTVCVIHGDGFRRVMYRGNKCYESES